MFVMVAVFFTAVEYRPYIFMSTMTSLSIFGLFNGFIVIRIQKFFGFSDWKNSGVLAAIVFPSIMAIVMGVEDAYDLVFGSSAATPFYKALGYSLIWLCVNTPMCLLGAYAGQQAPLDFVPQTSEEPKAVKAEGWFWPYITIPLLSLVAFVTFAVQI